MKQMPVIPSSADSRFVPEEIQEMIGRELVSVAVLQHCRSVIGRDSLGLQYPSGHVVRLEDNAK